MIDEKKLIEEIGEYTISVYGCDINDVIAFQTNNESKSAYIVQGICEAIDFIKEQPKVGEWIPVSERLPNEEEFINAYLRNKYAAEFIVMIKGANNPTTLYFTRNGKWVDEEWNAYDVIAWQPLPEPYSQDK